MYLEISPRQSGKTTRLIEEVKNHLEENETNKAWIFEPNYGMCNYTAKRIREFHDMPNKFHSDRVRVSTATARNIESYNLSNYKLFFDEFDFFNKKEFEEFLVVGRLFDGKYWNLENACFYTTPAKTRTLKQFISRKTDDILIKLLRKNKHNFISNPVLNDVGRWINSLPLQLQLTEAHGVFIK